LPSKDLTEARAVNALQNAARLDFRAMFEVLPSPYMVLDRNLDYVDANPAYCRAVGRSRAELLGRNLFELFPNAGPEGGRLRASFERVFATGRTDVLALIPYPIPRPGSEGGEMDLRYWTATHVPLLDEHGDVAFLLQNTVDVTELQELKRVASGQGPEPQAGEATLLQRAHDLEELNQALHESMERLRELFMQSPGFMAVLTLPDFRFALANDAYLQLVGHRPVVGKTIEEAVPEASTQGFVQLLETVTRTGQPYRGESASVLLQRTPDGPLEERFLDFIYQPIRRRSGEVRGVFVEGSDVTDRVIAERQQKLLVDELNHRVKNTLATVQSIVANTLRASSDLSDFKEAFTSRLMALSATHDILTASNWRSADLHDILAAELGLYGRERISMSGPPIELPPSHAVAVGLLLHELATNAAKYGALSVQDGRLSVSWTVIQDENERLLRLEWTESDGPEVATPSRRGFGSRLIQTILRGALQGDAKLDFAPSGVICVAAVPLPPEAWKS
jgi:PAS domain S-box-containing protein